MFPSLGQNISKLLNLEPDYAVILHFRGITTGIAFLVVFGKARVNGGASLACLQEIIANCVGFGPRRFGLSM